MQLPLRFGSSCSFALLLSACGGAAAPQKPAALPSQVSVPLQPLATAPDLSPVPAPKGLMAVGRLSRPGDLTKTLAGWVSLPFEPNMIDALQPGLSQAVAFDAPVEFAVVLPEGEVSPNVKPALVVSVGLSSSEKARSLLEEYLGQKMIERGVATYVTPDDAKYHCAIAAAVGKANSRFVCGDKPESLTQLLPYATRGLPLENLGGSDLHAELRIEPLRQQFGAALRMGRTMAVPALLKEVSLADPRFDRPLADVAHAVGDELLDLFDDADKLAIDVSASAKPEEMDVKLTIAYRGRASFVSQATADARQRMLAPNAQFFDLPADAAGAGFVAPADSKKLEKPRALIEALTEGLLAHFEVGTPLRREVRVALDTLFTNSSPLVFAYGANPGKVDKATPSAAERLAMTLGWRIYGVEAPTAPYANAVKTLIRLSGDKAFRQGIDALANTESAVSSPAATPKTKPAATEKKTHASDWVKFKAKSVAGMPAGSEVMLVEFNQDATKELLSQAKRKIRRGKKLEQLEVDSLRCLFAVVPDGSRTWFVFALDDKTLLDRAKVVLGTSQAARLTTRSDIASLRGQVANQAGFATLQFAKGWLGLAMLEHHKGAAEADKLFSTLPHHGLTPITYRAVVVGDEKRHGLEVSSSIPRAVFDDIAAAVPSLMMLPSD